MRRFAFLVLVALAVPPVAIAKTHNIAPPGNSGVSQYVESIPTAKGNQPSSSVHPHQGGGPRGVSGGGGGSTSGGGGGGASGGSGGGGGGGAISSSTQHALASQGSAGSAAAALAQATAPATLNHDVGKGPAKSPAPSTPATPHDSSAGTSPASAIVKALTGSGSSGGLGTLLPIILVASLIAASALALLRRRRIT